MPLSSGVRAYGVVTFSSCRPASRPFKLMALFALCGPPIGVGWLCLLLIVAGLFGGENPLGLGVGFLVLFPYMALFGYFLAIIPAD